MPCGTAGGGSRLRQCPQDEALGVEEAAGRDLAAAVEGAFELPVEVLDSVGAELMEDPTVRDSVIRVERDSPTRRDECALSSRAESAQDRIVVVGVAQAEDAATLAGGMGLRITARAVPIPCTGQSWSETAGAQCYRVRPARSPRLLSRAQTARRWSQRCFWARAVPLEDAWRTQGPRVQLDEGPA